MHTFFIDIKTEYGYEKVMEHVRSLGLMHARVPALKGFAQRIEIQGTEHQAKYFLNLHENLQIPGGLAITYDELGLI